jgi:hypothetical protein
MIMPTKCIALLFAALGIACAQVAPFQSGGINLGGTSTQVVAVPAGASPTLASLVVDTTAAGGDYVDVNVGDPSVIITLITPGGTEITSANTLGFTFSTLASSGGTLDSLSPLDAAGNHTTIQFPAGQPSGTYQVKANAAAAAADTGMFVQYYSSSLVQAGGATDSLTYRTGDLVIVSALLFDGTTPIQGAAITATATALTPLQATVSNYQLVSQQTLASSMTLYTYTVQVTNPGAAAANVSATGSSSDPKTIVVDGTAAFGAVAAGGAATSLNTFSVQLPNGSTFNPSVITWTVSTSATPINFSLTDSGTYDAATGDGIYTGTFTAPVAGDYLVYINAGGTSTTGVAFARTATAGFQVSAPLAFLGAFSDAPTFDTNGLVSTTAVTAAVNVQVAGKYSLTLNLVAGNGKTIQASSSVQLSAGSQHIVLNFPYALLAQLGANGPYTESQARLLMYSSTGVTMADYKDPVGQTQGYSQASISKGPLALTGPYTAIGVVTGAGPTFDLLQVTMGLYNSTAGSCIWSANLTDLSGNELGFVSSGGSLPAGQTQITLTFNGNVLAQSVNGPYLVKNVNVGCGGNQTTVRNLFQTSAFTASQFTYVAPNFSLSVTRPNRNTVVLSAGMSDSSFGVLAVPAGAFRGNIVMTVTGLPSGATGSFSIPTIPGGYGSSYLTISASPATPLGSFPITVTGTSGMISNSLAGTLVVTQQAVAVPTFSPSPTSQFVPPLAVTISTATAGASIRYTIDGTMPTETTGTLYTGPVSISSTTGFNAIAYKTGLADSSVASVIFETLILPNVTASVSVTGSGLAYDRVTHAFNGTLTVTNISGSFVNGPLQLFLIKLPAGITLGNATGTLDGTPFITLGSLAPGQAVTIPIQLVDPSLTSISYQVVVYSESF